MGRRSKFFPFGGGVSEVDGDAFELLLVGLVGPDPLPWRIVVAEDVPCLPMVAKQRGQVPVGQILVGRLRKMSRRRSFFGGWSHLSFESQEYQGGQVGPRQWACKASDALSLETRVSKMDFS